MLPKLWVNEGREQDGVRLVKGNGRVISMYGCGLLLWERVCLMKWELYCGWEEENGVTKVKKKKKKKRRKAV